MTDHWPNPLRDAAYHGLIGDLVRAIEPQTEADPVAVLLSLLVMFGNCIGRTPFFTVGADVHHINLFAVLVGTTAKGRKGMSRGQAQRVFDTVDESWAKDCITAGLSSGEGLIWAIRDEMTGQHPRREKGQPAVYETVVEDPGITDKRLLVIESEFASTLKVMARDGNTLSTVIRQAWDGHNLRVLTKNSPARATGPHVSIIGHITADELRRDLEATEAANGFGNRFLWLLVQRSKELPHGGDRVALAPFAPPLTLAVEAARRTSELRRDETANRAWESVYGRLSAGRPGMFGAMTARAEAQVMRLACLYALADASAIVRVVHLAAGLEVWRYCFESAAWLFGDRVGDPTADAILSQLRRLWPESMTRTEISQLFTHNKPAHHINRALRLLTQAHLVKVEQDRGNEGRPIERWCFDDNEINEINEITPSSTDLNSFNSFISSPKELPDGPPHPKLKPYERL
jgi:hypothetical protein